MKAGFGLGLAYLAKEMALLLLPALGAALLLGGRGRRALRTPGPYLGLLAALAIVGVDVAWSWSHAPEGHLERALRTLGRPFGPTLKGTSLYLGDLYSLLVGPGVLDVDYELGNAYAAFWPMGALYLASVAGAWRRRDETVRLLVLLFFFVFVAASLVDGRRLFDPCRRAALSFLPALLLAARLGSAAWERARWAPRAMGAALVLLALYDVSWLGRPGRSAPRLGRQEWAARIAADGEGRMLRGDLDAARDQAHQALLLDPDNAAAQALLDRLP